MSSDQHEAEGSGELGRSAWSSHLRTWAACAAAGGATLSMSTTASAEIIYNGTQTTLAFTPSGGSFTQGRKSADFAVGRVSQLAFISNFIGGTGHRASAGIFSTNNHKFAFAQSQGAAKKYALGQTIHANAPVGNSAILAHVASSGGVSGAFRPGTITGFVGFKSKATGDLGWIEVSVKDRNNDGHPDELIILASAYNNVSGGSIYAGQGIPAVVPEPNSLALLAVGAAGLAAWRLKRAAAAAKTQPSVVA